MFSCGKHGAFIDWDTTVSFWSVSRCYHRLQSVPSFPLCSNLLHLPVTNHFQTLIHEGIDRGCSSIQFFYPQTIHPKVVVNYCSVIVRYFHSLMSFSLFSVGLEDFKRRPKRVLGVRSMRFLPTCWHILSKVISGLFSIRLPRVHVP